MAAESGGEKPQVFLGCGDNKQRGEDGGGLFTSASVRPDSRQFSGERNCRASLWLAVPMLRQC